LFFDFKKKKLCNIYVSKMAEIKVIDRSVQDSRLLSREEREARLAEVAKTSKLPQYHFDNFLELEEDTLAIESKRLKPDITALLLRKLLTYDAIIPIVVEKVNNLKSSEDVYNYFNIPTLRKFGGKVKPLKIKKPKVVVKEESKEPKTSKTPKVDFTQNVQINGIKKFIHLADVASYAKAQSNHYIFQTEKDSSILVSGIYIDQNSPMITYFRDKYPWSMNAFAAIMSGSYSEKYIHDTLISPYHVTDSGLFVDNMKELIPGGESTGGHMYYLFKDEERLKSVCNSLFEYILYLETLYAPPYYSALITKAFDAAAKIGEKKDKNNQSELFKMMVIMMTRFQDLPTSVETKEVPIEFDAKVLDFLKKIQPHIPRNRSIKYNSSLNNDMISSYSMELFEKYMTGKNDINDYITNKNKDDIVDAKTYLRQRAGFEKNFTEMQYRWIYISKFGWEKFQELYTPSKHVYEYKNATLKIPIMSLLSKNVKDVVLVEYKRISKYTELLFKNNCPHLPIESDMRTADNKKYRLQKWEELKKFVPEKERHISKGIPQEMISCNNCKLPLICPHVRDLTELEKTKKSDEEIKNFINKYSGNMPISGHYYCKICGEPISDSTEFEGVVAFGVGQVEEYHYADDELRDFIWQTASNIVRNFTEFKGLQTQKFINKFTGTVVSSIYEFVFAIEKKLVKSKTSSLIEINNKKKLFTAIYVMAMLVKIISENFNRLRFVAGKSKSKGATGSFAKVPIGKLLGMAYNILIGTQNILITSIDGMSNSIVQNSLLKSYKVISSLLGKSTIPQVKEEEIITTLLLDPLYNYIISAHRRIKTPAYSVKDSEKFKKVKESLFNPKNSLGRDIKEMEKSEYVFEGIKEPKFDANATKAFEELMKGGKSDLLKPGIFGKNGLYEGYWIKSFQHTFAYIHSRMYTTPVWKVDILDDADETLRIEEDKVYKDYYVKYLELAKAERILFDLMMYHNMRSYQVIPFEKSIRFVLEDNIDKYLNLAYGDTINTKFNFKLAGIPPVSKVGFHIHKWDLVEYTVGGSKKIFSTNDKKKSELEHQSKDIWHVDDIICSKCFQYKSTMTNTKADIIDLIETNQNISSFYNFYTNQCPFYSGKKSKDIMHEFNTKEVCKNCGYEKLFNTSQNKTYYNKWASAFKKDLIDPDDDDLVSFDWTKITNIPADIKNPKIEIADKWKFNPNIIAELSNSTYDFVHKGLKNVKKQNYHNFWLNIGLTTDLDFDEILSGKVKPYHETSDASSRARLNQINTYIYKLMIDANILRNYKNIATLPAEIKELVSSQALLGVLDKIPDFTSEYTKSYDQMKRKYYKDEDIQHLSNFSLEFLCKTLMKIYKVSKATGSFIAYFVKDLFDSEKLLSKPKANKEALFMAEQKRDDTAIMQDTSTSDVFNTGPEKVSNDIYEGMDYNGQNEEGNT